MASVLHAVACQLPTWSMRWQLKLLEDHRGHAKLKYIYTAGFREMTENKGLKTSLPDTVYFCIQCPVFLSDWYSELGAP